MQKPFNSPLYVLILLELILAFCVGIAGNKIAELIDIDTTSLFIITATLIFLSLIITGLRIDYEQKRLAESIGSTYDIKNSLATVFDTVILSRIVSIFPLGILMGLLVAFVCVKTIPRGPYDALIFWARVGPWLYEVAIYPIIVVSIYAISVFKKSRSLVMAYCIGAAIGISVSVILVDPINTIFHTFLGWVSILLITGLVADSKFARGLAEDIKAAITNLAKAR